MKITLAFCCIIALGSAYVLQGGEWEMFKKAYGKKYYSSEEEEYRKGVYLTNKQVIDDHNRKYEKGHVSFVMKINQFGDMLSHEFRQAVNGYNMSLGGNRPAPSYFVATGPNVPSQVDWRDKGAVTPVKNQGQCGSCWAFSAIGSLEGQYFIKNHKLISLSEQNLVDCSQRYGNMGCNGGLMDHAFVYIKDNGGVDTEDSYPYEGRDEECRFREENVGATDIGFIDIPQGDENSLQEAVATIGPISVAIDAGHISFQFYSHGIYSEPSCSPNNLDHGVVAVGYGSENGQDYWLVKNSWGIVWGMEGYIKMARNKDNHCGIASSASFPLLC